jgi:hypothetical protein
MALRTAALWTLLQLLVHANAQAQEGQQFPSSSSGESCGRLEAGVRVQTLAALRCDQHHPTGFNQQASALTASLLVLVASHPWIAVSGGGKEGHMASMPVPTDRPQPAPPLSSQPQRHRRLHQCAVQRPVPQHTKQVGHTAAHTNFAPTSYNSTRSTNQRNLNPGKNQSSGLGVYAGAGLPNSVSGLSSFLPPRLKEAASRNVVSLLGLSPGEDYLGQFLTRAAGRTGSAVPSGCVVSLVASRLPFSWLTPPRPHPQPPSPRPRPRPPTHLKKAPIYSLEVSGGSCEVLDNGAVECEPPSIALTATPLTCSLAHTSAGGLMVGLSGRLVSPRAGRFQAGFCVVCRL